MAIPAALRFSDRITCLPVIHGSGDYAVEVRRIMLENRFDCLAVPLPPSFQEAVSNAVTRLPGVTAVVQPEPREYEVGNWSPDSESSSDRAVVSYVPVDPCQPVIAAIRIALQEHMAVRFIDPETARFEAVGMMMPDPYALKRVRSDRFAAAVLPVLPRLEGQAADRCVAMGNRLRELEERFESILFICTLAEWPWVREAYHDRTPQRVFDDEVEDVETYSVAPNTLAFFLGELPFITGLYERARNELDPDENLSIDGIKALLLESRDRYKAEFKGRARKITPKLAASYFQYVRNLSLVDRRLTPDLYTLIIAAQQIFGDAFAITLAETAREYPFPPPVDLQTREDGARQAATARWRDRRSDEPPARSAGLLEKPAAHASGAEDPAGPMADALEPVPPVQLAAGRQQDRELPHAHQRHGPRDAGGRPRPQREVHDELHGRPRHPRDASQLAQRRHLREGAASVARQSRLRRDALRLTR